MYTYYIRVQYRTVLYCTFTVLYTTVLVRVLYSRHIRRTCTVRYRTVQYCNKLCAAPRDADDQQQYNNTSYIVYEYEYEKCNIILYNP